VEEEIKGALKSSMKRKVGSLQEDRWMFEGGGEKRWGLWGWVLSEEFGVYWLRWFMGLEH
jgi:hypothetical protein